MAEPGPAKRIEHYLKDRLFRPAKDRLKFELAKRYRSLLRRLGGVCFIGVTGSCGKTTVTELLTAILAREGRTRKRSHENTRRYLVETVLSVSPRHRFCITEISAHCVGAVDECVRLLQPQIGVVTHVGQDHYSSFRTLEATATEKGKLVATLPANGAAVLNADDPHVYAMRARTGASVMSYGLSAEAKVRGENVSCAWPGRMSLDVSYAQERVHVQTQLLGEHWAGAVLAALATAVAAGVPLERAAEAVKGFGPVMYRMSPHETADGVTFISDTWKAPLWTIPACLDFMEKAQAQRKVAVIGTISDTPKGFYHRYKTIVQQALGVVDRIFFVGEHAHAALKARSSPDDERVMAFATLYQLDSFLRDTLQAGDLVLLKGTTNADHLHRLVLSRTNEITCWRERCGRRRFCSGCRLQYSPSAPSDRARQCDPQNVCEE